MSDEIESFFDTIFGKDGPFEQLFGSGGKLDKAIKKVSRASATRHVRPSRKSDERVRYSEALMTELLITLVGKGLITNADAKDVIAKAKERAKAKAKADAEDAEEKAETKAEAKTVTEHDDGAPCDGTCNGTCQLHDNRPHRKLECTRCRKVTPHLVEDKVARCRICVTSRSVS